MQDQSLHTRYRSWEVSRAPGFTLIELLLVVAVIALLIGLLLPSLAGARDAGRTVVCSSNLRQWAVAANTYAQESKGFLPRRGQGVQQTTNIGRDADWFNALPPLLSEASYIDLANENRLPRPGIRSVWLCPMAIDTDSLYFFAYAMNMRLSTWDAPQPDRIDSVAPTQRQVFMADGPGTHCSVLPSAQPYSPVARHRKSIDITFLDSHVSTFAGADVGCGVGDPGRNDIMWIVPNSPWLGPPH